MNPESADKTPSLETCRKILGKTAQKMSDQEIEELRNTFIVISDLAIDSFLKKTRRETNHEQ